MKRNTKALALIFILAIAAGWLLTKSVVVAYCQNPSINCTVYPTPYATPIVGGPSWASFTNLGTWDVIGLGLGTVLGITLVVLL